MPAIPSCTVDGVFGIARTTGTSSPRCRSIRAVVIAAATESTVWSAVSRWPISPSSVSMSCGLTASTTTSAPLIASAFEVVASTPWRSRSSAARSSRRELAMMSAQSELRSPASSDSPILPVPRIAIRIPQAYESGVVSRQEIHAREPGPLAVGLEQGVGLLGLDPPSPERRGELHEPEIAREARARSGRAPRGRRRRPTRARARAPARAAAPTTAVGRRFSASRSAPRQRRTSAAPRRVPSPSRRSSAGEKRPRSAEVGAACRPPSSRVAARITARSICRASRAVISCPATARSSACATVAVRIGRRPRRCWIGRAEQRVGGEPPQELRVVVVDAEHEAHLLEALLARAPGRRRCRRAAATRAPARARSPPANVIVITPSRTTRVASLPCRAESRSEYGPRGLSSAAITRATLAPAPAYRDPRPRRWAPRLGTSEEITGGQNPRRAHPRPGWGSRPATLNANSTPLPGACLCRFRQFFSTARRTGLRPRRARPDRRNAR